ncbi:hypothetical protein GCM10010401_07340 [Rarobacter faecitabidus]|uniref:Major capsid protein E n=1 Tax=Rarobacter faecitabidus TaxID=13243 RepID=A0A542Z882_RARFA|nr:major capsid protein [Rarobacter faecitabidus]TQL56539.1 major capsid protein E [Rarobacter faecitabidus]
MALWTDLIDPATLTGYARESLANIEARKGTLARWLPNREVADIIVRFVAGQAGLVPEAKYRAYDAEPTIGKAPSGKRVILELPAVGQNIPVTEYAQLRNRNAADDAVLRSILATTDRVVAAVADRVERLRGTVLTTGKATIAELSPDGDDFGRNALHDITAPALWSVAGTDRLSQLQTWSDTYETDNGVAPGVILMSKRALRALAAGTQFQTQLVNGGARPATESEVAAIIAGHGLPEIVTYDRKGSAGRFTPDDRVFLLPSPVETDAWEETELGATFWGQTLTSQDVDYAIEDGEQPGVVAGVYKNEKPPMIAEVISDAIALPVLANADLSFVAKVL